jgi:predicted acyl esterase
MKKCSAGIRTRSEHSVTFQLTTLEPAPIPPEATQYMVRMRDGVRLATDVYLPVSGEPTQAVLVRLCYDKDGRYCFMRQLAPLVTGRGYAFVVQDVRGKFRSEGVTFAQVHESADGYDTIDWVVNQPWSDGRVGMFGDSYYGFTQWAAVSSGHPALKAIVPRVTSANLGMISGERNGPLGTTVEDVDWLVSASYLSHYWLDRLIHDYELDFSVRPLIDVFERAFEHLGRRSASFDVAIPQRIAVPVFSHGHPFDARAVPVLHCVGWFDNHLIAHMRDYVELMSRPEWAPLQYLIADSVDHENYHLELAPVDESNDHALNDQALDRMLPKYLGPALDFFDVFLKEIEPVDSLARVRWHLGHEDYHESAQWPPPGSSTRRLFLGSLAQAGGAVGGGLFDEATAVAEEVSWVHDPTNLVPSAVENSFSFLLTYPDEAATGDRDDVLVFSSQPFEGPLDLAGAVNLHVRVASSAPTTDVFAKLLDVDVEGEAHMIVRGQAHLKAPSAEALIRVEMGHTGYRLRTGHRLRLHVASSDFPEYVAHPGTGENAWLAREARPSVQTLCSDPASPSYVSVTVRPNH